MKKKAFKGPKFIIGISCIILSFVLPLLAFLVPFFHLPTGISAIIMGGLVVGGPELMLVLAAIFLGKETVHYIKKKMRAFFRRKKKAKRASKFRYYTGIILLIISTIPIWLSGYVPELFPLNIQEKRMILFAMDLLFVCSFFIAGSEFWEKFKRLFIYEKK